MIAQADRRVRHLHLRAPDADALARAQILLADALRTASIDRPGRLVVVRRLDLGPIPTDGPPSGIALLIERKVRALAAGALHFADPLAEQAPVVWFPDPVAPLVALARRAAQGELPRAWFWRAAVPDLAEVLDLPSVFRRVLVHAFETDAGVAAAVEVAAAAVEAGGERLVAAALSPADGPALLARSGWMPSGAPAPRPADVRLTPPWIRALAVAVATWGATDARMRWLQAVAVAAERPGLLTLPDLPARAAAIIASQVAVLMEESRPAEAPVVPEAPAAPPPERSEGVAEHRGALPRATASTEEAAEAWVRGEAMAPPAGSPITAARPPTSPRPVPPAAEPTRRPTPRPQPTAYGGLYFLIRVLDRVGLPAWLAAHPEALAADLPRRVLTHIARFLGAAVDDPIFPEPLRFSGLRVRRRRSCGRPPVGTIAHWIRACAAWLRRAHLDLATVVRRPGAVLVTRTHLDVVFDLNDADLALRRLGLDFNPGYVPWLGRVFTFHFVVGGRLDD